VLLELVLDQGRAKALLVLLEEHQQLLELDKARVLRKLEMVELLELGKEVVQATLMVATEDLVHQAKGQEQDRPRPLVLKAQEVLLLHLLNMLAIRYAGSLVPVSQSLLLIRCLPVIPQEPLIVLFLRHNSRYQESPSVLEIAGVLPLALPLSTSATLHNQTKLVLHQVKEQVMEQDKALEDQEVNHQQVVKGLALAMHRLQEIMVLQQQMDKVVVAAKHKTQVEAALRLLARERVVGLHQQLVDSLLLQDRDQAAAVLQLVGLHLPQVLQALQIPLQVLDLLSQLS